MTITFWLLALAALAWAVTTLAFIALIFWLVRRGDGGENKPFRVKIVVKIKSDSN